MFASFLSWQGLLPINGWQVFGLILLLTHITIISVTVYLHRHSAHRALDLHPLMAHFFRFWLWLTTGMVTKQWTAIHRKHHAKCETPEDPHSPQIFGLRKVLWQGAELYVASSKDQSLLDQYGKGTPDDWLERHIYTPHDRLGVSLMLVLNVALFGWIGLTIWAVQMAWIPFFAAGVINGIAHFWGYRNFEVADASRNISPIAILIGGEELHNNHHTYPNSAKLSSQWWEFDAGWFYIQLMSKLKLAKVNRVPPKALLHPNKYEIDFDTLKAVVINRFHIMAQYRRNVIAPLVAAEKMKATDAQKNLFCRAKSLLCKERMDEQGRQRLTALLSNNARLNDIYQFKQQLQQIWSRTTVNKAELLQSLVDWCKAAEATGIEALQEFSLRLRRYTLASEAIEPAV
jgi:stearoyl-CoA desaturase (delta-9 desaturase)